MVQLSFPTVGQLREPESAAACLLWLGCTPFVAAAVACAVLDEGGSAIAVCRAVLGGYSATILSFIGGLQQVGNCPLARRALAAPRLGAGGGCI